MDPRYPTIKVKLVGEDSNVFNMVGLVTKALRKNEIPEAQIEEFTAEVFGGDYNHALQTCMKWVEVD